MVIPCFVPFSFSAALGEKEYRAKVLRLVFWAGTKYVIPLLTRHEVGTSQVIIREVNPAVGGFKFYEDLLKHLQGGTPHRPTPSNHRIMIRPSGTPSNHNRIRTIRIPP